MFVILINEKKIHLFKEKIKRIFIKMMVIFWYSMALFFSMFESLIMPIRIGIQTIFYFWMKEKMNLKTMYPITYHCLEKIENI